MEQRTSEGPAILRFVERLLVFRFNFTLPGWLGLLNILAFCFLPCPALHAEQSISFAKQIASILRESCKGCHIGGQQASGGLRMDTFAQLMRGGTSGAVIEPGSPDESLLIQKLNGTASGQRMPAGGRPALTGDQIELISNWVLSGAAYDGPTPDTDIDTVVRMAWASDASHADLFVQRQQRAGERWKQVMPGSKPATAASSEVFILGNLPAERLEEVMREFETSIAGVKKLYKEPEGEPLIRGGLVVFAFQSRYDYSEFGRMVEKREIPRSWSGHWRVDPVEAYAVLVEDASPAVPLNALASHLVTGSYWSSFVDVPVWFAEGVSRSQMVSKHRRIDPRIAVWQSEMPLAAQRVSSANEFIEGKMDEETTALVGMALADFMMSRGNRPRYQAMMKHLRAGKSFTEAMTLTFGPPDVFIKSWLGK